ncbi:hypothetical protein EG329_007031 [Mollisiaceae sp. DMI_Dod_QoI]|nr:hypothetical protein EG329_007031 [Helotiales sp. DMI_Dod_QoI]
MLAFERHTDGTLPKNAGVYRQANFSSSVNSGWDGGIAGVATWDVEKGMRRYKAISITHNIDPFEKELQIGTQAITSRGLLPGDFREVAGFLHRAVSIAKAVSKFKAIGLEVGPPSQEELSTPLSDIRNSRGWTANEASILELKQEVECSVAMDWEFWKPMESPVCHVCDAIIKGFTAPLEELYSHDLGTVIEVMSSPCDAHKNLIIWFIGYWEDQSFADHSLSIFKHSGDCYLELLRDDVLYPPFELISEIPSDASNLNTSEVEATIPEKATKIFGRGQILDEHWIRFDTIKDWYRICRDEHGAACHSPLFSQDLDATPVYFIDTQDSCIIPAPKERYISLSYVWGHVSSLHLERANVNTLTSQGALRRRDIIDRIPLTILHAIEITRLLGKRYLWVDSLCIVQDDESGRKQEQLNNMTAIYANASITLIAADGSDATYGFRGIKDISRPVERCIHQDFLPFPPYGNVVERIFRDKNEHRKEDMIKPYFSRGWTFQEYHFSKRRLVFEKQSVHWEC